MKISESFKAWATIPVSHSLDGTVEKIVTGNDVSSSKPNSNLLASLDIAKDNPTVLDFGCGVGRNSIYWAIEYPSHSITGYDNPQMLNRAKEYCMQKYNKDISSLTNLTFTSDWEFLKNQKFDVVIASLVFQHIPVEALNTYLEDIKVMTNRLTVCGRDFNDHTQNKTTWQILEDHNLYPQEATHVKSKNGAHNTYHYAW